jgi:hypothetical protein
MNSAHSKRLREEEGPLVVVPLLKGLVGEGVDRDLLVEAVVYNPPHLMPEEGAP